jgi:hypothetical protein
MCLIQCASDGQIDGWLIISNRIVWTVIEKAYQLNMVIKHQKNQSKNATEDIAMLMHPFSKRLPYIYNVLFSNQSSKDSVTLRWSWFITRLRSANESVQS